LIKRLVEELERIRARLYRVADDHGARQTVVEIARAHAARTVVAWPGFLTRDSLLKTALEAAGVGLTLDEPDHADEFVSSSAGAEIGLTGVDYAIADTGSLILFSGPGKARTASLLPPVHVAVLRPDQVLAGLPELFERLAVQPDKNLPSAVTFITGPSRTADIELTLVVGVHGPQELHVILIDGG
jgi:L-lactate utilization protein LutC